MTSLRLIFMGTPDFAVPTLAALIDAGHQIVAVYSQPPRPAGRGQKGRPSPVHAFAAARRIEVRTPQSLKGEAEQSAFAALAPDIAIVVAYGLILPAPILRAPRLGCLNLHGSLLPRWRGAAPIQRAVMAGDRETGVGVMQMEVGLDTGPVIRESRLPIGRLTTAGELHDRLAVLGAGLMVEAVEDLATGRAVPRAQPEQGVTYAQKILKEESRIDWTKPAATLERLVQGLSPFPGAWCELDGERLKVLLAEAIVEANGRPGIAVDDRLTIGCGAGALRLLKVQRQGKAAMDAIEFLRGHPVPRGSVLG